MTSTRVSDTLCGMQTMKRSAMAAGAPEKLPYLQKVDIFRDLTPDAMHEIETTTVMVTCEPGRVFYRADDLAEVLFILKKGEVTISRTTEDGKRLITTTVRDGTIFGEMPFLGQRLQHAQAEARTASLICVMSRRDVNDLLTRYPSIALRIVEVLSRRLNAAETRLEEMAFHGLRERLAALLLQLATEQDWRGRPMISGLTHQHFAELLGTYCETISATLNAFRDDGLLQTGRKRITLLQPDALHAAARESHSSHSGEHGER